MHWKPGDVVRLKSGGPLMTVESAAVSAQGDETVLCVWSEKKVHRQRVQRATFTPVVLERGHKAVKAVPDRGAHREVHAPNRLAPRGL